MFRRSFVESFSIFFSFSRRSLTRGPRCNCGTFEVNIMNRVGLVAFVTLFASVMCCGQTTSPARGPSQAPTPAAAGHGAFPVRLTKALDSSKLKEGDAVEVETAGSFKLPDGTLVPKGSKLVGHVTASKARSKGDGQSQLTVIFESLFVADGKRLSIKGAVQAVFPPVEEAAPLMAGKASGAAGGGYSDATVGTVTDAKSGSNLASSSRPDPAIDPKATGVQRMHDLELGSDGTLFSGGKRVKLDSGVRMIVRVDILG
jgi:hypothetical protein